ncbi:helix-turn-helix domain-containing protein [Microbacterium sp. G2-8]|uniref:TetR/AcrR family transcriptional regulator n=1 Tax=Microbacterium sp. G2-8 TaxID=2842454 RepID=UPI0027E2FFA7|nr:helix-turn-helix domain-containing protein [Microbacterium sp. G2-8]
MSTSGAPEAQSSPQVRSREATTSRLLDAAAEVFAEVGLGAASVEAVCERAGFTRGAFYSNFGSKDEMFLRLASRFARERTAAVHTRIAESDAEIDVENAEALVAILGGAGDDRFGALLTAEISAHAMRDAQFAATLRVEQEHMVAEVATIVDELAGRGGLRLRLAPLEAARLLLAVWGDASQRAAMEHLDADAMMAMCAAEMGRIVRLIVE